MYGPVSCSPTGGTILPEEVTCYTCGQDFTEMTKFAGNDCRVWRPSRSRPRLWQNLTTKMPRTWEILRISIRHTCHIAPNPNIEGSLKGMTPEGAQLSGLHTRPYALTTYKSRPVKRCI